MTFKRETIAIAGAIVGANLIGILTYSKAANSSGLCDNFSQMWSGVSKPLSLPEGSRSDIILMCGPSVTNLTTVRVKRPQSLLLARMIKTLDEFRLRHSIVLLQLLILHNLLLELKLCRLRLELLLR
jgi:hypothetical protein